MNTLELIAVLDKSSIDNEGESTITLKIPLQYIDQSLKLLKLHQTPLKISITPDNNPYYKSIEPVEL